MVAKNIQNQRNCKTTINTKKSLKITISTKDPENVSSGTETIDCDY